MLNLTRSKMSQANKIPVALMTASNTMNVEEMMAVVPVEAAAS